MLRRFLALAFCRADLLFEVDDNFLIRFVAGAAGPILGRQPEQLGGQSFVELFHEDDRNAVKALLSSAQLKGRINDAVVRLKMRHDMALDVAFSGYRVPDFENHFFIALKANPHMPVAPRKRAEVDRDDDTGMVARKDFSSAVAEKAKTFQDAGVEPKLTLVNIGNLDKVNSDLTQDQQAKVLGKIGEILKGSALDGDSATRIDNTHFAFMHSADVNIDAVTKSIQTAAKEFHPAGLELTTETSTVDADPGQMTEDQMTKAIAYTMKQFSAKGAKMEAGNLSEMLEKRMGETTQYLTRFRKICQTRDFDLVYMPIYHLKTRELHHAEALSRFRNLGDSKESPYQMISLAEEVGLITNFDLAVAHKVVTLLSRLGTTSRIPPIAVNVSGNSISDMKFIDELHSILDKAINLREMISIEITESSKIDDLDTVNESIQGFRKKGFKVALDDFGAGAAGFDYLNSLEIDVVKFDGPVVKRAYKTDKGKAFLASMSSLCESIGIETIAEMVEDEPLANFLSGINVHLGQGYYFGKPTPNLEGMRVGKVFVPGQ